MAQVASCDLAAQKEEKMFRCQGKGPGKEAKGYWACPDPPPGCNCEYTFPGRHEGGCDLIMKGKGFKWIETNHDEVRPDPPSGCTSDSRPMPEGFTLRTPRGFFSGLYDPWTRDRYSYSCDEPYSEPCLSEPECEGSSTRRVGKKGQGGQP